MNFWNLNAHIQGLTSSKATLSILPQQPHQVGMKYSDVWAYIWGPFLLKTPYMVIVSQIKFTVKINSFILYQVILLKIDN